LQQACHQRTGADAWSFSACQKRLLLDPDLHLRQPARRLALLLQQLLLLLLPVQLALLQHPHKPAPFFVFSHLACKTVSLVTITPKQGCICFVVWQRIFTNFQQQQHVPEFHQQPVVSQSLMVCTVLQQLFIQISLPALLAPPMVLILGAKNPTQLISVNATQMADSLYFRVQAGQAELVKDQAIPTNSTAVAQDCLTTVDTGLRSPFKWSCAASILLTCFVTFSGELETLLSCWHLVMRVKTPLCAMPISLESHLHWGLTSHNKYVWAELHYTSWYRQLSTTMWYTAKLVWLCAVVETATYVLLDFCKTDAAIKEKSLTSRGGKEGWPGSRISLKYATLSLSATTQLKSEDLSDLSWSDNIVLNRRSCSSFSSTAGHQSTYNKSHNVGRVQPQCTCWSSIKDTSFTGSHSAWNSFLQSEHYKQLSAIRALQTAFCNQSTTNSFLQSEHYKQLSAIRALHKTEVRFTNLKIKSAAYIMQ